MKSTLSIEKNIPINTLRRRFGEIEEALPFVDYFIITKKGKPFARLSATFSSKRDLMKTTAGAFKNTPLDRDSIWKEVLKKKSRKGIIKL